MRGMILAAGRGSRMGALTEHLPKPLLKVRGRCLIEYAIAAMAGAGIRDIVINVSWQGEKIVDALGDGERYGARFQYSFEPEALETGGGIQKALPLLGTAPFLVLSSDIILEHPLQPIRLPEAAEAHLLLVGNPSFKATGDFSLRGNRVVPCENESLTYANVGIFSPVFFARCRPGKFALGPMLQQAVSAGTVTGEHCVGRWWNIGTPELLAEAEAAIVA